MNIRNRITIIFLSLTSSLLLLIFMFIYFFANRYTNDDFYIRLNERANIAAQAHLEKDELTTSFYKKVFKKHLEKLPHEKEIIFGLKELNNRKLIDSCSSFSSIFLAEIISSKKANAKKGKYSFSGILYQDNQGDFIVIISAMDLYGIMKMKNLRNILIVAFLFGVCVTYLIGRYYSGKVLEPISTITKKTNEISISNLHLRLVEGKKNDELSMLSKTINQMLDRLENSFELQNNFINNASHEFKNPLTAIIGETEITLSRPRKKEEYETSLVTIQKEAQKLNILINSLFKLTMASDDGKTLMVSDINLYHLILEVKKDIDTVNPENEVIIDVKEPSKKQSSLKIKGSGDLIKVALTNVIDNACKFSDNNPVLVRVYKKDKNVVITVIDHGIGIPPNELKNITEPFYRANNVRRFRGFGVGLPLSKKIIQLHGGTIEFSSEINVGTEVDIIFPQKI